MLTQAGAGDSEIYEMTMPKLLDLSPGAIFRPHAADSSLHLLCEPNEWLVVPEGCCLCVCLHTTSLVFLDAQLDVFVTGDVLDLLMQ